MQAEPHTHHAFLGFNQPRAQSVKIKCYKIKNTFHYYHEVKAKLSSDAKITQDNEINTATLIGY